MKKMDYGNGSILKNILLAAGPMMLAQIFSLLYNIVDRIYIGRIPGVGLAALSGIGICFPLISLITAFTYLFGSGGAPLYAIELGRKNEKKARGYLNTSFVLLTISSILIMVFCFLYCRPILRLFGATEASLIYALPYMKIYLTGTFFFMIATGMTPFINAKGYVSMSMISVVSGAVANIVLDPLFIFTFNMGIAGAAWATVLSQLISFLIVIGFILKPGIKFGLNIQEWKNALDPERIWSITSLGFSGFIMSGTNALVQIVCNNMLSIYGGDLYISVMTIVSSVRQILDTPIAGLRDGSSPILSFNYGARKYDRLKRTIWIMTAVALIYSGVVWALILTVPEFFIALFSPDPALDTAGVQALNLYFFAFIFQGLQYCGQTVFQSLNRRKSAIFFSLFRKVIIVVPLTLWLPALFGVNGVFLAEPISNVIGGSACFITMILTVYRKLGKTKTAPAALCEENIRN